MLTAVQLACCLGLCSALRWAWHFQHTGSGQPAEQASSALSDAAAGLAARQWAVLSLMPRLAWQPGSGQALGTRGGRVGPR